jgi:hypothetical protein
MGTTKKAMAMALDSLPRRWEGKESPAEERRLRTAIQFRMDIRTRDLDQHLNDLAWACTQHNRCLDSRGIGVRAVQIFTTIPEDQFEGLRMGSHLCQTCLYRISRTLI